jgi:deoxyribonuclease V
MSIWPASVGELVEAQARLAREAPPPWLPPRDRVAIGGCFVCFARGKSGPGAAGDPGWAGAVVGDRRSIAAGTAGAAYQPGLLALREGPLLESAVRDLGALPDVLLANATGRDHPRGAGLALHLGAVLGLPTVGVTHRTLLAEGAWPADERGATSPLFLEGRLVGYWLRTRAGTRPLAIHAAWRTGPETAVDLVLRTTKGLRTPAPLREARRLARTARSRAG